MFWEYVSTITIMQPCYFSIGSKGYVFKNYVATTHGIY